ncbi:MAG TPA: hypothetical protein VEH55_09635 [Gaiellaceae bacterium]|jgi:hypothetical protein|nr:hypothetical protein [Gaiellaceae bacterium]
MDGNSAVDLHRRHPLRVAALVAGGVLLVAAVAVAGLYVWFRSYAPLAALDTDFAPGSGVGADVQPVAGSGGKPVFFPAYRRGRIFEAAFTLRNTGRFQVTVAGLAPRAPATPPWVGPVALLGTDSATASADPGDLLPFQEVKLARGDTAILVVRYRLDCRGAKATTPDVYSDSVRLRFSYLSLFHRTQTVTLPFAVTLRCVGGPPATP